MARQGRCARSAAAPPQCIRWTSSRRWPAAGSGSSGWGTRGRRRDTSTAGISGAAAGISAAAGVSPAASVVGLSLAVASSGFPSAPLSSDLPPRPATATTAAGLFGLGAAAGIQRAAASQPVVQRQFDEQLASSSSSSSDDSIEDAVAGLVMDAATKFIGRAIGRRVKRAYEERVVPAMAAKQEAMLREQIAIAERYPDLRACLTDKVIFLAGGSRVVPMSSLSRGLTLEQADAVVAQLRNG